MSRIAISGFKAYDLRGRMPGELNDQIAYRIGRAYAEFVKPRKVIVGRDIRLSSEQLAKSLEQGLLDAGVDVHDIGLCGTEVVYYATFAHRMDCIHGQEQEHAGPHLMQGTQGHGHHVQ